MHLYSQEYTCFQQKNGHKVCLDIWWISVPPYDKKFYQTILNMSYAVERKKSKIGG